MTMPGWGWVLLRLRDNDLVVVLLVWLVGVIINGLGALAFLMLAGAFEVAEACAGCFFAPLCWRRVGTAHRGPSFPGTAIARRDHAHSA